MTKAMEMRVVINGAIGSNFTQAFRRANSGLVDMKGEARAVQREMNRLAQDFRQGKITQSQYTNETRKLGTELRSLENEMNDAAAAQRRFARETAAANRRLQEQEMAAKNRNKALMTDMKAGVGNAVGKVATTAKLVGMGAAVGAAATAVNSINVAAEFEAQLSTVGSKVQATTGEMKALRQSALELGASTSLDASTTVKAMDELAAKGMNANQIIGAMPGIIAGAEASGEDLTLVSDVVTSAINTFGMQASEASRVSDIMSMSAIKSAAGVSDLGYSFKYAAPMANTLGISIEELAASTGLLVDGGLAGEQAGNALRMAMVRLSAPPTDARKALKKLNLTAIDSKGKFKSLAQITEEWNEATRDLTDAQKVQNAAAVFGSDHSSAMLSLFAKGSDSIRDMTKALEESEGAALATSKAMKDNFLGAKEQMMGAIDTAQIAFATPLLPILQDTMSGIGAIVENNMENIENMGKALATVVGDITAPIAMKEPIRPIIEPYMDFYDTQKAMSQYATDLEKYELFGNMSGTEKIHYMLDETIETVEGWVGGSGGKAMESLFTEVGTVAGKAWWKAFKASAMGAVGELAEGNVAGALAMGATANALSGGLLISGGAAVSKWAFDKGRSLIGRTPPTPIPPTPVVTGATSVPNRTPVATISPVSTTSRPVYGQNASRILSSATSTNVPPSATSVSYRTPVTPSTAMPSVSPTAAASNTATAASGGSRLLGWTSKIMSKVMVPLAVAGEVMNIARSEDKVKATAEAGTGLAGSLGGAKAGAIIGTMIAPGIGTAVFGALGGLFGYIGGKYLGGKATDAVRGDDKAMAQAPIATAQPASVTNEAFNISMTATTTAFTQLATSTTTIGTTMATSMTALDTQTKLVTHNMGTLVQWTGQASGWIATLNGIQPAGQRVITALNNLEQRINSINLPGISGGGRTAYE